LVSCLLGSSVGWLIGWKMTCQYCRWHYNCHFISLQRNLTRWHVCSLLTAWLRGSLFSQTAFHGWLVGRQVGWSVGRLGGWISLVGR
jgi:membrane protein YqaA with SNARE-associated domain